MRNELASTSFSTARNSGSEMPGANNSGQAIARATHGDVSGSPRINPDLRELSPRELEEVSGGAVFVPVLIGAAAGVAWAAGWGAGTALYHFTAKYL